jgi:type I restriction enzyme S subunit
MANDCWVTTTLDKEVDLLTGFPFKSSRYTDALDGIKLVRGDNVVQGRFRWQNVKRWPREEADALGIYQLEVDDVVLAMDRPWIEAGLKYAAVALHDLPAMLVQRVARLRGGSTLDTGYLRYLLGSPEFTQHVLAVQTGTAVPHISGQQIKEFRFRRPSLPLQRRIANILRKLDDKIELNRRMNRTLEKMAEAIFKSWFIDFDPVHAKAEGRDPNLPAEIAGLFPCSFEQSEIGAIPKGWHVKPIGDAVRCVGGATPSTKNPEFWERGRHPFVTPKDMSSMQSSVILDSERHITDAGVETISSKQLPVGTVILSSRAPIGYLGVTAVPVSVNQGVIAMVCDGNLPSLYVLHWTAANMDLIKSRAGGTTFAEISKQNFRPIPVLVPDTPVLEAFITNVAPLHERITMNVRQCRCLAGMRDALLPKLLSGAIKLPEAEKPVEGRP